MSYYIHSLKPNEIFVFGSNLAGRHGKGAALQAREKFGAIQWAGRGLMGRSYAIPTKGYNLEVLPLEQIKEFVQDFKKFALTRPDLKFLVTEIGTGLAGYKHGDIAVFFADSPSNVVLPPAFKKFIKTDLLSEIK